MGVAGEASEKAPDAPYAYTPPTKSSKSKTKKPNQPNNSPEEDLEDLKKSDEYTGDDDLDDWLRDHPMPMEGDFDFDGDGVLNDEERERYNEAWDNWASDFEYFLWDVWFGRHPGFPGEDSNDERGIGEQELGQQEWEQREPLLPGSQPMNPRLPRSPVDQRYDYDLFWDLYRQILTSHGDGGLGMTPAGARQLYDWLWRLLRHGKPGFEGISNPLEYDADPWDA